jgi:hypothetical protein
MELPMVRAHANLTALRSHGGCDRTTIDLGRPCHFLVWGAVTTIQACPESPHASADDAVVLDIFTPDCGLNSTQIFGGPYHDPQDPPLQIFKSARRGYGRRVTFLLRNLPSANVDSSAIGIVLTLEGDPV